MEGQEYCKEYNDYYDNEHPEYGGVLTDLRTLPVGTPLDVANGEWTGEIIEENGVKGVVVFGAPDSVGFRPITEEMHSLYLRQNNSEKEGN